MIKITEGTMRILGGDELENPENIKQLSEKEALTLEKQQQEIEKLMDAGYTFTGNWYNSNTQSYDIKLSKDRQTQKVEGLLLPYCPK